MKKKTKTILISIALVAALGMLLGFLGVFGINGYVKSVGKAKLLTAEEAAKLEGVDCILVLGCKVNGETPSDMLEDRLLCGVALYQNGAAPKLLMSGDHGTVPYDEVNAMKQFAIDKGVPSSDIFMDHAGFSTYESVYRAKEIFGVEKMLIVTQEYHLYRALYIARELGIEAYGVHSDYRVYVGQTQFTMREILARNKDFFACIFKVKPTYLGDAIPINGNGDQTNDKV